MGLKKLTNPQGLTSSDEELFGRIAYAMVVVGLWTKATRRNVDSFDFFEIRGQNGEPAYRIGRQGNGAYVLLTLPSGVVRYGETFVELLRTIAYVPDVASRHKGLKKLRPLKWPPKRLQRPSRGL